MSMKDWNIKFIFFVWSVVCVFLFNLCNVVLFKWILLLVDWLRLVNKFNKVDLFELDVFIIVIEFFDLILKLMLLRMVRLFLIVVIVLESFLIWIMFNWESVDIWCI